VRFTLHYRGDLKSNRRPADKHRLRKVFHKQLSTLWQQQPLFDQRHFLDRNPKPGNISIIRSVGPFHFAPLICTDLHLLATLRIHLMRPCPPGDIIRHGGDIDNRLKTLLDALRMPSNESELPKIATVEEGEDTFFCLFEDDSLITGLSVNTARLLEAVAGPSEVELLVQVCTEKTVTLYKTIDL